MKKIVKLRKKEWENKQKEISEKKDDLSSQSSKLTVKEKELNADYQVATELLDDANRKLVDDVKKGDLHVAAVAQALLETGREKLEESRKGLVANREKQAKVEKRKQTMLDEFVKNMSMNKKKK